MKYYGNINLNENELQNMVLGIDTAFPATPKVGRVVFANKRVFIAVELVSGTPTWVPLTNELDTYVHSQNSGATTWTITHNLNTTAPLVQIYDNNHTIMIPDVITITDNNTVTVTFATNQAGRAVIFHGSVNGSPKQEFAYTYLQTSSSATWVIPHELGYYPVVRVFVGATEIQPDTIVHDTLFQTTLTFSSAVVGNARLV